MKKVYFTKEEKAKSFSSKVNKPVSSHKNTRGQIVYTVTVGNTPPKNDGKYHHYYNHKPAHLGEEYKGDEWVDYCWSADDF